MTGSDQKPAASSSTSPTVAGTSRRDFMKMSTVAAVAAATAAMPLASSVYAAGTDTLKYGLIGCGGRGSGAAANALHASSGNKLVAMADLWPEKIEASHKSLNEDFGGAGGQMD